MHEAPSKHSHTPSGCTQLPTPKHWIPPRDLNCPCPTVNLHHPTCVECHLPRALTLLGVWEYDRGKLGVWLRLSLNHQRLRQAELLRSGTTSTQAA